MMTAKEARHNTDARISDVTARAKELLSKDVLGINLKIEEAITSCQNKVKFEVSKFFKDYGFRSEEEQNIFMTTCHNYFKDLGYAVGSWEVLYGIMFEISW